jgi:hypothetical protein
LAVDYVRIALDRKFTMRLLARVDAREYKQRTLVAALGFIFLGGRQPNDRSPPDDFLTEVRLKWRMLSFRKVNPGDPDLDAARSRQSRSLLTGDGVLYGALRAPSAGAEFLPGKDRGRPAPRAICRAVDARSNLCLKMATS